MQSLEAGKLLIESDLIGVLAYEGIYLFGHDACC